MKRAGFTMIELIFVIVILGILAAVALPKFIGVSQQAHDQKVTAFVGTLNRTVGPSMWAASIGAGTGGVVLAMCPTMVPTYLDAVPTEVTLNAACGFDINASSGGSHTISFVDGNATNSPRWTLN